jgi:hypothetical protein
MTLDHVEGYRRALDVVARERKYLTMLEAQPEPDTLRFVKQPRKWESDDGRPCRRQGPSAGVTFAASSSLRGRTAERSAWVCCRNGAAAVSGGVCSKRL